MKSVLVISLAILCLAHARKNSYSNLEEHYQYNHHDSVYDRPYTAHHHHNQQPEKYTTHRVPLHPYEVTTPAPSSHYSTHAVATEHHPDPPQHYQRPKPYPSHAQQYYENSEDYKGLKKPLFVQPFYFVKPYYSTPKPYYTTSKPYYTTPKPVHKPYYHQQRPNAYYPSAYPHHHAVAQTHPGAYRQPSNDYNYHYGTTVLPKPTISHHAYKPSAGSHYEHKPTASHHHEEDSHKPSSYEHKPTAVSHKPSAAAHHYIEESHKPSSYEHEPTAVSHNYHHGEDSHDDHTPSAHHQDSHEDSHKPTPASHYEEQVHKPAVSNYDSQQESAVYPQEYDNQYIKYPKEGSEEEVIEAKVEVSTTEKVVAREEPAAVPKEEEATTEEAIL